MHYWFKFNKQSKWGSIARSTKTVDAKTDDDVDPTVSGLAPATRLDRLRGSKWETNKEKQEGATTKLF